MVQGRDFEIKIWKWEYMGSVQITKIRKKKEKQYFSFDFFQRDKWWQLFSPALQWLWQEEDLTQEVDDMQRERESMLGERKTLKDVLRSPCVRWQLLTLCIPCAGLQFCGINAVCSAPRTLSPLPPHRERFTWQCFCFCAQLYFYIFDIFRDSGVPEGQMSYLSIGVGATELIAVSLSVSNAPKLWDGAPFISM